MSLILLDRLGDGSFGDVYACRFEDRNLSHELQTETWAVKRIEKEDETFNNLIRELHTFDDRNRVLAKKMHVPYRPIVFFDDEFVWIVMEKFTMNCAQWFSFDLNCIDLRRAWRSLLFPLNILHEKEWSHRDIKPKNMFINVISGHIVLGDFGSSSLYEKPQKTLQQTCTIDTRAPEFFQEVHRGEIKQPITYRSDMWSAGITLLCGILHVSHSPLGEVHPYENDHETMRKFFLKRFKKTKDDPFPSFFTTMTEKQMPNMTLEQCVQISKTLDPRPLYRSSSSSLLEELDVPVTPKRRRSRFRYDGPISNFTQERIILRNRVALDGTVIPLGRYEFPMQTTLPEEFHYKNLEAIAKDSLILPTLTLIFEKCYSLKVLARIQELLESDSEEAIRTLYFLCATIANGFHSYKVKNYASIIFQDSRPKKLGSVFSKLLYEAVI